MLKSQFDMGNAGIYQTLIHSGAAFRTYKVEPEEADDEITGVGEGAWRVLTDVSGS